MNNIPYIIIMVVAVLCVNNVRAADAPAPTPVIASVVEYAPFLQHIEALGTLSSVERIDVMSTVTERVTALHINDNMQVNKGDVLIELESAEEKAELAEQQSFLEEAQRQVRRLAPLVRKGAASVSLLDESKRIVSGSRSRIDAIKARIDRRIIRAPFDGTVGLRRISKGALAQPGEIITTLDDMRMMNLDFSVPETFLADLRKGAVITAQSEAYPDTIFNGNITAVDSRIDPVTRSVVVRAVLDNTQQQLRPGLLMRVNLEKNTGRQLIIPEEAVVQDGNDSFVYIVANKDGSTIAERRQMKIGGRRFGDIHVSDGLEEGEKVIIHGMIRLRPNAPIQVTIAEDKDASLRQLMEQKATAP